MEVTSRRRQEGGHGIEMIGKLSGNSSRALSLRKVASRNTGAANPVKSELQVDVACAFACALSVYVSSDAVEGVERESGEKTQQIAVQIAQMRPSVSPGWCAEARARGETVVTCVRAGLRCACSFALYVVKCVAMETAATNAHAVWRATRSVQVNAPAVESMTGAMNVDASDDRRGSSCVAKRLVRGTHVHTKETTRRRRFRPTVQRAW
eukprot:6199692-Pleurochrysis_carterae.AAC.1